MMELSLVPSFAILALNAQDSINMTTIKKIALRSMASGVILELYLNHAFEIEKDKMVMKKESFEKLNLTLYQENVLRAIMGKKDVVSYSFGEWLKRASLINMKQKKALEKDITSLLICENLMEEIPNLLGCDMDFDTAGLELKEYRSEERAYSTQVEMIRAEMLEDSEVTDEVLFMFWLLRESGCLTEMFSQHELEQITKHVGDLHATSTLAKVLLGVVVHKSLELGIKIYLKAKTAVIKTQTGTGVNFTFPIIERSQAIFIEADEWFAGAEGRLESLQTRLEQKGHKFTVIRRGGAPLLKIDNVLYEAIPTTRTCKFPIQGVQLRRYPIG